MKLSIPMMVKNESKNLDKVLESLKPIMEAIESELIIIDTGSDDDTVEIARKYTDRVYFHKWNNNFSQMRNITIGYAKGEWLLMIDGDEVLEDPQPIIDFLVSKKNKKIETGLISIVNLRSLDGSTDHMIMTSPRIFRNRPDFGFTGAIHNQPSHKAPYQNIPATLIHYGYVSTDKELMDKKFERTGDILKTELEKDPENIYYWYQLCVTYSMHEDHDLSVAPIEKAYSLAANTKSGLKGYIYIYISMLMVYMSINDFDKAEKTCEEALEMAPKNPDIQFFSGKIKATKYKYEEALKCYRNYIDLLENFESSELKKDITMLNYSLGKYNEACAEISRIYLKLEKYQESLDYYEKIKELDLRLRYKHVFINSCINLCEYDRLIESYECELHSGDIDSIEMFEIHIENTKDKIDDTKKEKLERLFSKLDSNYGIFNRMRTVEKEFSDNMDNDIFVEINSLDFSKMPVFYGDLIYYMLKRKRPLSDILSNVNIAKIRIYFDYIVKNHTEFHIYALEYIKHSKVNDIKDARVHKELGKYALLMDGIEDQDFKYMLERYLEDGIYYIKNLYHPLIIEKEMVSEIKEQDEIFLLYLYKGRLEKESDPAQYVKYLKKAIQSFPFKKAIDILKDELERQVNPPVNEEMESLKKQFKDNIKILIAGGLIEQAEAVINQYEQIISSDEEILLFKSYISLMKIEDGNKYKKTH